MASSKSFLSETADTASFAFREYFRPLVAVTRFLKSRTVHSEPAEPAVEERASLQEAQALLRERLAKGRHHERILLIQAVICAIASLLAVAISFMYPLDVGLAIVLAVLLPISAFAVWLTVRLVQNREEIIELKTLRWVMKSLDRDTAESVIKQVSWGKTKKGHRRKGKPPADQERHPEQQQPHVP
jgi:hypothetical protein